MSVWIRIDPVQQKPISIPREKSKLEYPTTLIIDDESIRVVASIRPLPTCASSPRHSHRFFSSVAQQRLSLVLRRYGHDRLR